MNILLIGGSSRLMDSMILKLRKEGHRVFLLTGDNTAIINIKKSLKDMIFPMTVRI